MYVRLIGVWPGFVCLDARTSTFPNFVPPSNNILDYNIASKLSGFTSVRDEQTKTQYAYNSVGFVSYDDERAICDKTEYVIDRNLNGYIIWEISGDLMPDLSTPLLDATNNRLNKLDIRCDLVDWEHPKPATQHTTYPQTNSEFLNYSSISTNYQKQNRICSEFGTSNSNDPKFVTSYSNSN